MAKILIADDEQRIRQLVGDFLSNDGHIVLEAADGEQALTIIAEQPDIDLVVLDVMMPGYDGWTVCREIRRQSQLPVIMLTARSQEADQLLGFNLGVDDYVAKPFSPSVLVARVTALLRRSGNAAEAVRLGQLVVDAVARTVKFGDETLNLTPKEFELLLYLAAHRGQVFSREQLLAQVWGYDYQGGVRTVDTHVNRLRIKLGPLGDCLKTCWGFGYKLEVPDA